MKKAIIVTMLVIFSLFLISCNSPETLEEETKTIEVAVIPPVDYRVVDVQPKEDLKVEELKIQKIIIGGLGSNYNGNTHEYFMANTVVDFTGIGRDNLGNDKFYLERLWNVRNDNSKMIGNSGTLVISTTAKKISMEAESPEHYTDIYMRKGEGVMPNSEMGSSVAIRGDGMPGVKIKERGVFNLVNRNSDDLAVYSIAVEREGLTIYKLILEY
jgi:hypothetical protein